MRKLNKAFLTILFIALLIVRVKAASVIYEDIPWNSYVIGTHLYTHEVQLSTKHIMLAAKTIEGHKLNDMIINYKTSRGKWTDGLTGEEKAHLSSYIVNYEDSQVTTSENYEDNYIKQNVSKDDIPGNSYVIGRHLFTSNIPLSTKHIMLGAQTIDYNTLGNMKMYYKTSRGKWIDGLSGEEVNAPNAFIISYVDLEGQSKEEGYVTLSAIAKNLTHGTNSTAFNITSTHGGEIIIKDDNDTATTSISGNTVTVSNLKTLNAGTVIRVTVTSAETEEYTEASATYTITVKKATLGVPEVTIDTDGVVTWSEVSGASSYEVSFDNVTYEGATSGNVNIPLTNAGEVTAYVRGVPDNNHVTSSNAYGSASVNVYSLTLTKDEGIDIVSGSGNYVSGHTATISATLNEGYEFNEWVSNGDIPVDINSLTTTVTLTQNTNIEATSGVTQKTLGYVTLSEIAKNLTHGTNSTTFNITSSHGGEITIEDDNEIATTSLNGNTVTVSNLSTIDAGTVIRVKVISAQTNSHTEGTATYTITVTKATLGIPEVTIDTDGVVTWNEVNGALSYEVSFDNINYTTGTSGNVIVPLVNAGQVTVYVKAKPDNNHITSSNAHGTSSVNVYSLALTKDEGINEVSGTGYYVSGKVVSISASLKSGYRFAGWVSDESSLSNTNSLVTTILLTQNTNVEATSQINTLYVKYHSDGGTWNPSHNNYTFNISDGFVYKANNNEIYAEKYHKGDSLPSTGFVDYNGGYFNWSKEEASVPSGKEYFINNDESRTYLSQNEAYSIEYLTSLVECDLDQNDCEIVLNVNWVSYLITNKDYLSVSGTNFIRKGISGVNGDNKVVLLNGFNLGEWLSRAISLTPITDVSTRSCSNNKENAYAREYPDNNVQINYALTRNFYEAEFGTMSVNDDLSNYLVFNNSNNQNNEIFKKVFNINEAYYTNFINEEDIEKLAEMGTTAIRVPVEWSYFAKITKYIGPVTKPTVDCGNDYSNMDVYSYEYEFLNGYDSNYNIIKNSYLDKRMKHLDWVVEACRRNGIYVIFDLHVVPGSANSGGILSKRGGAKFFETENAVFTSNSLKAQEFSINIWKLIAKRFEGNPGVAGYELLNEPGYPKSLYLFNFYDNVYNSIREIDSDHIIIMESPMKSGINHYLDYTTIDSNATVKMPTPAEKGWTNIAYSVHDYFDSGNIMPDIYSVDSQSGEMIYGISDGQADDLNENGIGGETEDILLAVKQKVNRIVDERNRYGVPIYIGEVNWRWNHSDETWPELLEFYNDNGLSYTFWAYKVYNDSAMGLIYNSPMSDDSCSYLLTDEYNTILNKFSKTTLNGGYVFNSKNYYGHIKSSWNFE